MKYKIIIWLFLISGLLLLACANDEVVGPVDEDIGPTNHPPIVHTIPDTSALIGDTLKFIATAEDEDGDSIFFGSISLYNNLTELKLDYQAIHSIDRITGAFWFLPTNSDYGTRRFIVFVNDSMGGADTTYFAVSVH